MHVLIVDDHALIREGIVAVMGGLRPDARIDACGRCDEALALAAERHYDLVLLDLQLPDRPGFHALEALRQTHPETPVVVVSAQEDRATVLRTLDLGARSFIPKSSDTQRIRQALGAILAGQVFLPDSVFSEAEPRPQSGAMPWQLTDRQLEVLQLLVAGLSNKLIARRLDIAESTVKIHVSAILRELKVGSRTQALIAVARAKVSL